MLPMDLFVADEEEAKRFHKQMFGVSPPDSDRETSSDEEELDLRNFAEDKLDHARRKMIQAQSSKITNTFGETVDFDFDEASEWAEQNETGEDEEILKLKKDLIRRRKFIRDQVELSRQMDVQRLNSGNKIRCADSLLVVTIFGTGVASIALALVNWKKDCDQPLQMFLMVLGCMSPFAAFFPTLVRHWFYLQLRISCLMVSIIVLSILYALWFLSGQVWAFRATYETCPHRSLIIGANCIAFAIHFALLVYLAKLAYYISFQLRYRCSDMWWSCIEDPYPSVDRCDHIEFQELEAQFHEELVARQLRSEKRLHPQTSHVGARAKKLMGKYAMQAQSGRGGIGGRRRRGRMEEASSRVAAGLGRGLGARHANTGSRHTKLHDDDDEEEDEDAGSELLNTQDLEAQLQLEQLKYEQRNQSRRRREEAAFGGRLEDGPSAAEQLHAGLAALERDQRRIELGGSDSDGG